MQVNLGIFFTKLLIWCHIVVLRIKFFHITFLIFPLNSITTKTVKIKIFIETTKVKLMIARNKWYNNENIKRNKKISDALRKWRKCKWEI